METSSDMLNRFYSSLQLTQSKNDKLIGTLDDVGHQLERLDNLYKGQPLAAAVNIIREAVSESLKPNKSAARESESLMKLLESRLTEIRAQEKHNDKQIMTIEKERREINSQKSSVDEQRRLVANDKEKMEIKIEQERCELGTRTERLVIMARIIEQEPESLDTSVIHEAEKGKLKSELAVLKKAEEIKGLENMCERYQQEIKKVRDDAREAIKVSENQATEACKRLKAMNAELLKSQETARKMQQLLVGAKERNKELKAALDQERIQPLGKGTYSGGDGSTVEGNLATIPGLSRAMIKRANRAGNMPTATRVEELLKRNEQLRLELESTHKSLGATKMQYTKVKEECMSACSRLNDATVQASTLKQSRDDVLLKLRSTQQNYELLNRSLTKQAASWVNERVKEREAERAEQIKRLLPRVAPVA